MLRRGLRGAEAGRERLAVAHPQAWHGMALLCGRCRALRHGVYREGESERRRDPLTGQPQTRGQKRTNTNKQLRTNGAPIICVMIITVCESMLSSLNYLKWDGQYSAYTITSSSSLYRVSLRPPLFSERSPLP